MEKGVGVPGRPAREKVQHNRTDTFLNKRYKVGKQEVTATHSYSGEWQALNLFMHLYTVMYDTHAQTQQSVTHTQDSYWKWEFCPPEDMP